VSAKVSVGGVTMDSMIVLDDEFDGTTPLRIAFSFAQGTDDDIVDYVVEAKMLNSNNGQVGNTQTVDGRYIVVDRRDEFGQGWWLSGA
jgi:hypothetical protein